MASRSIGVLTLDLVAKIGGFVDGLSKAEREAKKRSEGIKKNLAAIGAAAAAAATAIAASGAVMVKNFAENAQAIDRLAKLSNASTTEFQKYAFASKTLGIEQDKLSDILKDVNDKVGDFLQTGGGPLADFFEKIAPSIGVTAEQFANLSGPQALQLYVDSLQKANLSQAELTFYMEAIASDATLLLPLLKNNGAAFNELAAQAERYGVILDQEVIQKSLIFQQQLQTLSAITQGFKNQISAELLPTLINLNELLIDLAESGDLASTAGKAIGAAIKIVTSAALLGEAALRTFLDKLGAVGRAFKAIGSLDFRALDDAVIGGVTGQFDRFGDAIERVRKLWGDVGEEAGKTGEIIDNVGGGGGGKPPLGRFRDGLKETKDEIGDFIKQLEFAAATVGMTSQQVDLYRLSLLGASDAQLAYATSLQETVAAAERQADNQEYINSLYSEHESLITGVDAATMDYNETMAELNLLLQEGVISQQQFGEAAKRASDKLKDSSKEGFESFGELAKEAAKKSQGALADFLFDPFSEGLDGMLEGFANTLQRMVAEAAAAQIMDALLGEGDSGNFGLIGSLFGGGDGEGGGMDKAAAAAGGGGFLAGMKEVFTSEGDGFLSGLGDMFSKGAAGLGDALGGILSSIGGLFSGGGGGGFFSSIAGIFGGLFGGGRANGGPVWPGSVFEVGEFNRPELLKIGQKQFLIPGNNGSVEPMSGTMGRGVTQVFNVNTPNPDAFRLSERQMMRRARQGLA